MQRKHTRVPVLWEHVQNIQVGKKNLQNLTVINLTLFPCNVAKNKVNSYRVNKHGYLSFHLVLVQYIMTIKKQNHLQYAR